MLSSLCHLQKFTDRHSASAERNKIKVAHLRFTNTKIILLHFSVPEKVNANFRSCQVTTGREFDPSTTEYTILKGTTICVQLHSHSEKVLGGTAMNPTCLNCQIFMAFRCAGNSNSKWLCLRRHSADCFIVNCGSIIYILTCKTQIGKENFLLN